MPSGVFKRTDEMNKILIGLLCIVIFAIGCWYISKTIVINLRYVVVCTEKNLCVDIGSNSYVNIIDSNFYGGVSVFEPKGIRFNSDYINGGVRVNDK